MDLDECIITIFCLIDEALPQITQGQRVRQRGPAPTLWDSEVSTMEVVGEYLGLAHTRRCLPTFGSMMPISSLICARCIARPCASSRQPVATLAAQRSAVATSAAPGAP